MKYYSELTGELFNTIEELETSESDETKEIQDLLYEKFSEVNNELENYDILIFANFAGLI